MTSELRPAVEVWRQAHQALYWLPKGTIGEQGAAAVIEADREAVRAEQAAEIERLREALLKICHHSTDAFAHDTAATALGDSHD